MAEDFLCLQSGEPYYFLEQDNTISITDVAHSLSHQCRYNGHCDTFYSVAEHCTHLTRYSIVTGLGLGIAKQCLLHDAGEAILSDIPRPIKAHLPDYKVMEMRIDSQIREQFGLPEQLDPIVAELDFRILKDEKAQIMTNTKIAWECDEVDGLDIVVQNWQPDQARFEFLDQYQWLEDQLHAS